MPATLLIAVAVSIALGTFGTATATAVPKALNGFIGGPASSGFGGAFIQPHDVVTYTANTPSVADDKLLVVEAGGSSSRIQRLDGDGNFELIWGRDVVRPGFPGNTGTGYEVCSAVVSGVTGCKLAPTGAQRGELNSPTGVVVDNTTGHVFVMDHGNRRVQEFDLDGSFVRAWGGNVAPEGQPGDTPSNGLEVCTAVCQVGAAGSGAGQFESASVNSIALSPLAPGHLFVTDAGNQRIQEFEADGDFVRAWGWDVSPDGGAPGFELCAASPPGCQAGQTGGAANGQFAAGSPSHVVVDLDGVVYASDVTAGERIVRFDSDPAPAGPDATSALLEALPSPALLSTGVNAGLEVDPVSGNLFVTRDRTVPGGAVRATVQEISDPAASVTGGPPTPAVADTHVIADDSDGAKGDVVHGIGYHPANGVLYSTFSALFGLPNGNFSGCAQQLCVGLGALAVTTGPPTAVLDAPADVGASTVQLEGVANPSGGVAAYRFQVSRDGTSWNDADAPRNVAGSSDRAVSASVSGLEPATLYRVRLIVTKQNEFATTSTVVSNEDVFLTDADEPRVRTLGSTKRTDATARLRGQVDPNGSSASYRFEYGPSGGSFDHHVPAPDAQAGAGNDFGLVTVDVSDLQPGTKYQYRLVATNFVGTTVGGVVEFTTKAAAVFPPPPGRAYELVSPTDKVAGVGVGIWYQGPITAAQVGFPAYDGERFAVQGTFGAVLGDSEFSFGNDWVLADRSPQGWVSRPVATRAAHGSHTLVFMNPNAGSPDLSMTGWSSTNLKLFSEMEDWDIGKAAYLRDSAGKWEAIAPTDPSQGGTAGDTTMAADGRSAVISGVTYGLAGPDDPTLDQTTGSSVYRYEIGSDGLSDTFPGAGTRSVVNVCSAGTEIPARIDVGGGSFELGAQACPAAQPDRSAALVNPAGASLGAYRKGTVSADGSRIFFISPTPAAVMPPCSGTGAATSCPPQLYVHQRTDTGVVTRWLSKSEVTGQEASLLGPALFEGASDDGDKVFFRTNSPLTVDDPNGEGSVPVGGIKTGAASPTSWDLYMYDLPDDPETDLDDGDLVRISAGPQSDGDCNSPNGGPGDGALRYMSDSGSRLYFACAAPLDGVPLPDDGTITDPGGSPSDGTASNLYAYDASRPASERWRFVARLPRASALGNCATAGPALGVALVPDNQQSLTLSVDGFANCVRGSSDGATIAFFTDGQLTDDDPDATSGDIYLYDAAGDDLIRVTAPRGGIGGTYSCTTAPDGPRCYGDQGFGPTGTPVVLPPLTVPDDPDGDRVAFFQSRSRLVAADTDGAYDVYQWRNGELSLISTGGSDSGAFFEGIDRTGRNVFFATRDRLSWQDRDAVLDVYSARVGTGIPQPPPTEETCDSALDQCQGPGTLPGTSNVDSDSPGAGNPPGRGRVVLGLGAMSSKARKRAARSGVIALRLRASASTTVKARAKARIGERVRTVARTTATVSKTTTIRLRLNSGARKRLRAGKPLVVTVTVTATGARREDVRVKLRR